MSDPLPFDMPDESRSFEERGGWLTLRLARLFQWQLFQAAGFVGNPGFESGGFAVMQERGIAPPHGGWGWSQWTGPRRRAFEAWANGHQLPRASSEANYGFMVEELRTGYQSMLQKLRQTSTIEEATFLVGRLYEAPGGTTESYLPGYEQRLHYAQRALAGAMAMTAKLGTGLLPDRNAMGPFDLQKEVQRALAAAGFDPGPIDGDPGPRTRQAMNDYRATLAR